MLFDSKQLFFALFTYFNRTINGNCTITKTCTKKYQFLILSKHVLFYITGRYFISQGTSLETKTTICGRLSQVLL